MHTDLSRADLRGGHLRAAMVQHTDLTQADLTGADFTDVMIGGTTFIQATFGDATFTGLEGTVPVNLILLALVLVVLIGSGVVCARVQLPPDR